MNKRGFTLIEILVSMAIIGIMASIAGFGIRGARESARDAKRKADLQNIRTAFELFYSDCNKYPAPVSNSVPEDIIGDDSITTCAAANTYLSNTPADPQGAVPYAYARPTQSSFVLCTYLEGGPETEDTDCQNASLNCPNGPSSMCNFSVSGP